MHRIEKFQKRMSKMADYNCDEFETYKYEEYY